MRRAQNDDSLRCSFCRKSQDVAGKLISSPSGYPRAYICDECIAICVSIIEDDRLEQEPETTVDAAAPHPLLAHPLASELMDAIKRWIQEESLGNEVLEEILEVRRIAGEMIR
jgi:ATP-dependent protease Clp ATPase subunit